MPAAKDAGATVGGFRLAGAMAVDQSTHGGRLVSATPVSVSRPSSAGSTVDEERAAALATFNGASSALQQPKCTPAKRKSMTAVWGEIKINATRMGSKEKIYGSSNPFSIRTGAQWPTAGVPSVKISDVELSAPVRVTMISLFLGPHQFGGCSLTAETVTTDAVSEILSECAVGAGLSNVTAITAVKQYILELRRANENLGIHFTKVGRHPKDNRPYRAARRLMRLLNHLQEMKTPFAKALTRSCTPRNSP